jgi:hypothetical protein
VRHIVVVLAVALAPACNPKVCGPSNCQGCCAPDGTCELGMDTAACGSGGNACDVCVGAQVCAGECVTADAGTPDAGSRRCDKTPTVCSDQAIQQLDLKTTANPAAIMSTSDAGVFYDVVDATAGGITPTKSFVYAKFTDVGLVSLNLDDQAALDSTDWDIAFRRFVIRLNGGTSGPSCVDAFVYPASTSFDAAATPDSSATFKSDATFTAPPACMFIADGSGLMSSPATALDNPSASFYTYTSCVKMSGRVFAVRTREGRIVKLEVTGYYQTDAAQMMCQGGTMPMVAGGYIHVRWAFLQ